MIANCSVIFLLFMMALISETISGSFGISIPLLACLVFYLASVWGWQIMLLPATVVGAVIDLVYARPIIVNSIIMPMICLLPLLQSLNKGRTTLLFYIMPGAIAGIMSTVPWLFIQIIPGFNWSILPSGILTSINAAVSGALIMPLMIIMLDSNARLLGMPTIYRAQPGKRRNTGK